MAENRWYAGLDGCPAGLLVARRGGMRGEEGWRFDVGGPGALPTVCEGAALALIDVPIGLPNGRTEPREADRLARRLLPGHGSRVFSVPVRRAVYARSYDEANRINGAACGKGVTRQAWNICPQIRRVDAFLRSHRACVSRLRESSPEVCFRVLAQEPLPSKKTGEGREGRIRLLERFLPGSAQASDAARSSFARRDVRVDDILDAMVLCLSAMLVGECGLPPALPQRPVYDDEGLPMQMVYPPP